MSIPRAEHPRPSFIRNDWLNLNGEWSFIFDPGKSGIERGFQRSEGFDRGITVPFCPESPLSGIGERDFVENVWYQKVVSIPENWRTKKILLHIAGADYETEVFVDSTSAGRHYGGSSSFTIDLTKHVSAGKSHNIVLFVQDNLRTGHQLGGKQSLEYNSAGCFYTRTTGIWQTVWLEAISPYGLERCVTTPHFDTGEFVFTPVFYAHKRGFSFKVTLRSEQEVITQGAVVAFSNNALTLKVPSPRAWSPQDPFLYDILFEVFDEQGAVIDSVQSYAGLRKIHIENNILFLNNERLYLRFVLDQGFYPDGLWTAPSDEALKKDIELSKACGFNGARLHQKVFEERFHYWADKLGYLTWAESPSWGLDVNNEKGARNFLCEWREIILRDQNHPSIIGWTTLNETWDLSNRKQHHRLHLDAYELTRALDPARPINNASGGCQVKTDLYTVHIYEQDPQKLKNALDPKVTGSVFRTLGEREAPYEGQPYIVDEFGGIKWTPDQARIEQRSWGYGEPPTTIEEFYTRLKGQVDALLSLPHLAGYCYTQLTDVEQEQNGLYFYDRTSKFDLERLRKIFGRESL